MNRIDLIESTWHHKIEDKLSWNFCAGVLKQDDGIDISGAKLKREYIKFFKEHTGYTIYDKCPKCSGEIVPRRSSYGYFVSCSEFPNCDFKGGKKK